MPRNNFQIALINMADGQLIENTLWDDYEMLVGRIAKIIPQHVIERLQHHMTSQSHAMIRDSINVKIAFEVNELMLRHPVVEDLKERVGERIVGAVSVAAQTTPSGGHAHGPECAGCHDHTGHFGIIGLQMQQFMYHGLPAFTIPMKFADVVHQAIIMDVRGGRFEIDYGKYTAARNNSACLMK